MFRYFLLTSVLSIELTLTYNFLRHENLVVSLLTTLIHEIKYRQIYCFQFNDKIKLKQMSIINNTGKLYVTKNFKNSPAISLVYLFS